MIRTLLLANVSLWGCLWQSTLFAVLGLLGSFLLRRRPARAHQVLLLAVMAAILVPALSGVVRHFHLGLLARQVTVPAFEGPQESRVIDAGAFMATSAPEAQPAPAAQLAVASPDGVSSVATRDAWRMIALWTWAAATLVLLGRLLFAFTVGVRLARRARPLSRGPVVPALSLAKARLGVNKDLQIRTDAGVRSPVIWCWGRQPVLLLPDDVSGSGGGIDWAGVIAHELAHWKRGDHVSGLLAELAVCALPWNPLLWLSKRHLVSLTEQACDDWVVASGQPAEDYAESLLDFKPQNRMAFVPAVVHSKRGVASRVRRILNDACGNPRAGTKWALGVTIVVVCVAVGFAFAQTRPAGPEGATTHQGEPAPQSADKPAADSEKPEQPRFAARTFNSKMAFNVFVHETLDWDTHAWDRELIGRTPSDTPLQIPACWVWFVEPVTPVEDWDLLVKEINRNNIPGLRLPYGTKVDSSLTRLAACTGLQYLNWSSYWSSYPSPMTDAGLAYLRNLTNLQYLNLQGCRQVTDAGLQSLKELKGLRYLNLWGTQITDAGLVHLKGMTGLQGVNLNQTQITGAGLERLKGLSGLRKLGVLQTHVTDPGLVHIKGLTELRTLNLQGTQVTDAGLEHLKGLTKLQELSLNRTEVTDAGLAHLAGRTGLTTLKLNHNSGVTDAGLAYFKGNTGLVELGLFNTQVTDATMADFVKNQSRLQFLRLGGTRVTDGGLIHLEGLKQLRSLDLWYSPITDAGLIHLEGLKQLRSLDLSDSRITDAGLIHLKGLTRLRQLWLNNTGITDAGLEHLKGLTQLEWLGLDKTKITDEGLALLRGLTTLESLTLRNTRISGAGFTHLKDLPRLQSLSLQGSPITDVGLEHLKGLTKLFELRLSGASTTDAGLRHIEGMTELGCLEVSDSQITDAGLEHLTNLTGLRFLHLQGNTGVTGVGLRHLKGLSGLSDLSLGGCAITDAGLEHLKGLPAERVFLENTKITDAGLEHLKTLTGLVSLNLSGTQVTDAGVQQLQKSLPRLEIRRSEAE